MTQHAHHAARYGAVAALASALLAPNVNAATALEAPAPTPDPAAAQTGQDQHQAQGPAVNIPGEGNARMPQAKVEQPAAQASETASVTGTQTVKNGQNLEVKGTGWGANTVIAVKYDRGAVKPAGPVTFGDKDLSSQNVVAVIQADADGNFMATLPFPAAANWAEGSTHQVNFLSGTLHQGDEKHSAALDVTVENAAAAETPAQPPAEQASPKAEETPAQTGDNDAAQNDAAASAEGPQANTPADQPKVQEPTKADDKASAESKTDDTAQQNDPQTGAADQKPPHTPAPFKNSQTVESGGATVTGVKYAKVGQDLEVKGSGWGANTVIAVKYDRGAVKLVDPVMYGGQDLSASGVATVIQADADGNFTAKLPFPTAANWAEGSTHEINFLSGSLHQGDKVQSVALKVTVGEPPAYESEQQDEQDPGTPNTPGDGTQKPNNNPQPAPRQGSGPQNGSQNSRATQNPSSNNSQTIADGSATVTGPINVQYGQGIVFRGSGWSPNSVIAVKYDGGAVRLADPVMYGGKDLSGRGVVAIIQADANGNFTATLPFPNSPQWSVGSTHEITFLTGSLHLGDEQHSVTLQVTVTEADGHAPASALAPVANNTSGDGANYGIGSYQSLEPIPAPAQNFNGGQASLTSGNFLTESSLDGSLVNRLQARAKAAAQNGSAKSAHVKSAPKKTAKAAPGKKDAQGNATAAATQADGQNAPTIIGAELTGFSKWFANNANNVLLSIAGLIILVLALTFRKRA